MVTFWILSWQLIHVLVSTCAVSSQLTVLTQPEALVSSSGNVVEGSVIQIYCTVEMDTTVTFTWTLNGSALLNDPPHIRIREDNLPVRSASLLTDDSTSVFTVDNFRDTDNGVYQCTATNGAASSGNGTAITLRGVVASADGTLMLMNEPSDNEPLDEFFNIPLPNDNRTGIALGDSTPLDSSGVDPLLTCTAGHQGDGSMSYSTPSVVWVRNGQVVDDTDSRITLTSTTMTNGRVTSSLTITNFGLGDTGEYQCVFTDDSDDDTEVITSIPYQLDTGNTIHIERVSPEVIILRPPDKLVIEVRVSGEYLVLLWNKGILNQPIPGQVIPEEFPNYNEIFVRDNTTAEDEGIYLVSVFLRSGTSSTHTLIPTGGVDFAVISPDNANTMTIRDFIVILEGESVNISCRSEGAPVPSITWEFNNQTTVFEQSVIETPFEASLTGGAGNREVDLTPGNIVSTLHIVSARYPDHDGVYTCIGTNSDDLTIASSSAFVTVQVNVIPEVEITASSTTVIVGQDDVTITCSVLRGIPANYSYSITHIDTDSVTFNPTLTLTDIQMSDLGTYRCDVNNDAGTESADVTIEQGERPNPFTNVVAFANGARWIALSWEPSFDGNRSVTSFSLYISSVDVSANFTLISSISTNDLVTSEGNYVYNVSDGTIIYPQTRYSFTVVSCNRFGCSDQSDPSPVVMTLEDVSLLIQLHLVGVDRCQQWVVDNGRQKLDTLSVALSVNVEERCQCGFSVLNILEPRFRCFTESEDAVTYRAEIIGTRVSSPADIATHIQEWITQGALVTFDFVLIEVDSSCQVIVTSVLDPECNNPISTPSPTSSAPLNLTPSAVIQGQLALIGGVSGGVVLLVIIVVVVNNIVCCWMLKRKKELTRLTRDHERKGAYQELSNMSVDSHGPLGGEYEELGVFTKEKSSMAHNENQPSSISPLNPLSDDHEYDCITRSANQTAVGKHDDVVTGFGYTDCAAYNVRSGELSKDERLYNN